MSSADDFVRGAGVEDGSRPELFVGEQREGTGYVELVEDGGVAPEFDDVVDCLGAEGVEDALFFRADVGFAGVDSLAEGGPFGVVEGAGAFAGADGAEGVA